MRIPTPFDKSSVFTTSWDDGHPLDLRLADLLGKYCLSGTFYVPLEPNSKVLTSQQIRQIAAVFEVGAHTVHHRDLTSLPAHLVRKEISEPKQRLQDTTGKPCSMFCFPQGKYRSSYLAYVREAGYIGTRTVELMSIEFPREDHGIMVMPTSAQVFSHPVRAYLRNIARRFAWSNLLNYIRVGRSGNWVAAARSLAFTVARRGGVFHLWGHSWEIEETGQWRQLEEVFGFMSDYRSYVQTLTNADICRHARQKLEER